MIKKHARKLILLASVVMAGLLPSCCENYCPKPLPSEEAYIDPNGYVCLGSELFGVVCHFFDFTVVADSGLD